MSWGRSWTLPVMLRGARGAELRGSKWRCGLLCSGDRACEEATGARRLLARRARRFPWRRRGALAPLVAAFPGIRHHPRSLLTGDVFHLLGSGPVSDDPMCSGPVLQPGRTALLQAVRDQGFRRVFDGEGGDELFAMARRPGDLIREGAVRLVLFALASRAYRRPLLRDFFTGGRGAPSNVLLDRARGRVRARRPWLRPAFWESHSFDCAWEEYGSFVRLRSAPERLPELLGVHGRYWRTQELVRLSTGVRGTSPILHQRVVELVGSVHASVAMDLANGKGPPTPPGSSARSACPRVAAQEGAVERLAD